MPSYQISVLMMFVGKCLCTSHVLQYSSYLSYEHSRSPQSFLCSAAVTVLICSFFVAALLILHNFKKRQQIYTLFHNPPNIFQTIFRPKLHIHKVYKKDFLSRGDRHGPQDNLPYPEHYSPTCKRPWCQTPDRHKKDGGCIAFWL